MMPDNEAEAPKRPKWWGTVNDCGHHRADGSLDPIHYWLCMKVTPRREDWYV
jgi:hypothetical protein